LPAGTYILQIGQLEIQASLSIEGENRFNTIIDGNAKSRVIQTTNLGTRPIINISDVTIQNGSIELVAGGGMVVGQGTYVTLYRTIVVDNNADGGQGAGIANLGNFTVRQSTIRNNSGFSKRPDDNTGKEKPCVESIFTDRNMDGQNISAGGIFNNSDAFLTIDASTISENCSAHGGGIKNLGHMDITNSTISGNKATLEGGGIMNVGVGYANIAYTTIAYNEAFAGIDAYRGELIGHGGGIYNTGDVDIGNSIIAGNQQKKISFSRFKPGDYSPDCYSDPADPYGFTSSRGNLLGIENVATCDLRDTLWGDNRFDIVGTPVDPVDPRLEALADNGGPTMTHALRSDSPAVDQGTGITSARFFDCPDTDQRGFVRPVDGDGDGNSDCDIGAFELGATQPEEGLVAHWKMENNTDDETGAYDGTLSGGAGFSTDSKVGSYSLLLDGNGDYLSSGLVTDATDDFTMTMWVKWAGSNNKIQCFISNGSSGKNGFTLYLNPYNQIAVDVGRVGIIYSYTAALKAGTWQHVAIKRDSGVWKIFLDANPVAIYGPTTAAPNTPSGSTYVGTHSTRDKSFNGKMDDVRIYERALNDEEIYDLANP
jgi:hypothetical protein